MTKDQNLENCRAQVKRLQGELKLMNKENALLNEKLNKNNPEVPIQRGQVILKQVGFEFDAKLPPFHYFPVS